MIHYSCVHGIPVAVQFIHCFCALTFHWVILVQSSVQPVVNPGPDCIAWMEGGWGENVDQVTLQPFFSNIHLLFVCLLHKTGQMHLNHIK